MQTEIEGPGPLERKPWSRFVFWFTGRWPVEVVAERLGR